MAGGFSGFDFTVRLAREVGRKCAFLLWFRALCDCGVGMIDDFGDRAQGRTSSAASQRRACHQGGQRKGFDSSSARRAKSTRASMPVLRKPHEYHRDLPAGATTKEPPKPCGSLRVLCIDGDIMMCRSKFFAAVSIGMIGFLSS